MISTNRDTPIPAHANYRIPLHSICPYFAMFPETFVRKYVEKYSMEGDWVFDPFSGRGTTLLEALMLGRKAAASDINPVAFCISSAKAQRPSLNQIKRRIQQLKHQFDKTDSKNLETERHLMPRFFRRAFYHSTLRELLFLRANLDWQNNRIDGFITALIIGSLHGDMDRSQAYFSNQMPRTVCLKPDYSLRYWSSKQLYPKKRNVFTMLLTKADLRLQKVPSLGVGVVKLLDARKVGDSFRNLRKKVKLVITSPPYLGVTRYEEDQWLRLWFLGGSPWPTYGNFSKDDRHESVKNYWMFLTDCWHGIQPIMALRSILVIRMGGIDANKNAMTSQLMASIVSVFPKANLVESARRSKIKGRQTQSFLPSAKGCRYEFDYVFRL